MAVVVYGTAACTKCAALKRALKQEGIEVEPGDPAWLVDPDANPGWRENGATDRLASLVFQGWDLSSVPVIEVDGEVYDVSDKTSVELFGRTIHFDAPVCKDGACSFTPTQPVHEEELETVAA